MYNISNVRQKLIDFYRLLFEVQRQKHTDSMRYLLLSKFCPGNNRAMMNCDDGLYSHVSRWDYPGMTLHLGISARAMAILGLERWLFWG